MNNYYIDFDDTLFDTNSFKKELNKILEQNGLDKSCYAVNYKDGKDEQHLLNIRNLFKYLSNKENIPLENLINPLEKLFSKLPEFVHKDSIDFLNYLKSKGNKTYILTWGDQEFQREKVFSSKLNEFVDGVIYTEKLKYQLENIDYKNSFFIDDSVRDLTGLYNAGAKKVIRIKRKNGKNSNEILNIKDIPEFETLNQLQIACEKHEI